ncbi:transcriptional regulator2C LysR family [Corallococcus coralloides DSM 2259]|uniref:Transcriptional regulator2C LysR family n=1 Tax=Corallococcus coralloides (strain ATCC 25202 / DSM 2259 / NBRC 100086 / M2) TaxID=1144275 RepID=H8MVT6_CORCM|nr:transcriptional regulator2C LysR family [Corallococcus coralloides DSM 2259]
MDSISEIEVFIKAVDLGGFTRAAESLGLTPSGVSRIISRLEGRLGVRLLNRTTRSLSLTDEGALYHEHCTRMLAELEAVNATLARTSVTPRGRLRVDVPIPLADYVVGPALPRFLERYPEVSVDLTVRDRIIDPTAEGVDVVLRLAPTRDSDLVSRRLGRARSILVASPAYLAAHGRPRTLASLREHTCIAYLSNTGPLPWRLKGTGGEVTYAARGRLMVGSGNVLTHAALGGLSRLSFSPFTCPWAMCCAKTVLKAFTTRAWGAFFCSSSAPLVVKPSASCMSAVNAFVTSTTTLPFTASPSVRSVSSSAPKGTARNTTSAHAAV